MSGFASLALFCLVVSSQQQLPPMESLSESDLPQLVEQLGSDEFSLRRSATRQLLAAGAAAHPLLVQARESTDHEIRRRAEGILKDLDFGITPDLPLQMQSRLREFRDGNASQRAAAFQWLAGETTHRELQSLIRRQPDATRPALVAQYFNNTTLDVARFPTPSTVLEFVNGIDRRATWRLTTSARALFAPKLLQAWLDSKQLAAVEKIVMAIPEGERSTFTVSLLQQTTSIRTLVASQQFPFVLRLVHQISNDNDRSQTLLRFFYDAKIVEVLVKNDHWDAIIKEMEAIKDEAAQERMLQSMFGQTATIKHILETKGFEYLLKLSQKIKKPETRGRVLARLFANTTIQQHLAKEGNSNLAKLVAEQEQDKAARREYLKTLLQSIRYRSDVEPTLVKSLWDMIKLDEDVTWQVETVTYIVQSNMGQRLLKSKEELKWVLDLLGTKDGQKAGYNALRYIIQNSNNFSQALKQGHFETIWQLIRKSKDSNQSSLLSTFFSSSTLLNQLKGEKRVVWFVETIEKEDQAKLREAMLLAVLRNYSAMSILITDGHYDRLLKQVNIISDPTILAGHYGALIKANGAMPFLVKEKRVEELVRFAKADTPPAERYAFLVQVLDSTVVQELAKGPKKFDELRKFCDAEKDKVKRSTLLSKLLANAVVIQELVKQKRTGELLDFADQLDGNNRRNYLQRVLVNKEVIKSLLAAGRADDILKQIRATTERYQRTSLFSSLIQSDNLTAFVKHKALAKIIDLVKEENDQYARRQMVYYLLGRSDTMPKVLQTGKFDELLNLVQTLDDRTRADMLLRMFNSSEAKKVLVKEKKLRKIVEAGMNGPTEQSKTYFRDRLFGNASALDMLIEEGYMGELEAFAVVKDEAKRVTYQTGLYTCAGAIKRLTKQKRLAMLLELAINQPNEQLGSNLYSRIIGTTQTVDVLAAEGRFEDLLQIAELCTDPTERGKRSVYILGSSAMLKHINDKGEIRMMLKQVLDSDSQAVRISMLQRIPNSSELAKHIMEMGFFDQVVKLMGADLKKTTRRTSLCNFLAMPVVLEADKEGKNLEIIFKEMAEEPNSYNRNRTITKLSNAKTVPILVERGQLGKLIKLIEREPSESSRGWMLRSALLNETGLKAVVEAKQSKLVVDAIKSAAENNVEQYFLQAFASDSGRTLLADPVLALFYFELVKKQPASNRTTYLQTLLANEQARGALVAAGHTDLIQQCIKLLPKSEATSLDNILYSSNGIVTDLIAKGMVDRAVEVAKEHATSDLTMLRYATVLRSVEQLETAISSLEKVETRDEDQTRQLIYLLRARGTATDRSTALELAEGLDDAEGLIKTLAVEARNWKRAAELQEKFGVELKLPIKIVRTAHAQIEIEHLGLLAAYQRLSGQEEAATQTLDAIQKLQKDDASNDSLAWHAAQAFFLNGRFDAGLSLIRSKPKLLSLRIYRQEYQKALEAVGFDPDDLQQWISSVQDESEGSYLTIVLQVASIQRSLGDIQGAHRICAALEEFAAEKEEDNVLRALAGHHFRRGDHEEAWRVAGKIAEKSGIKTAVAAIYGSSSSTATAAVEAAAWLRLLTLEDPDGTPLRQFQMLHQIVSAPLQPGDHEWFRPLASGVLKAAIELEGVESYVFRGLAITCRRRGLDDVALEAFTQYSKVMKSPVLDLAEFLFDTKQWKPAAEEYMVHWKHGHSSLVSLYMAGECFARGGDEARGEKLKLEATSRALQSRVRHTLAKGLIAHGLIDEAKRQLHIITQTAPPEHWEHNDAYRLLAIHTPEDLAGAAVLWRVYSLGNIRTNFYFNVNSSYLSIPLLTHKLNVIAALEAGDDARAKEEVALCHAAALSTTAPVEDLAPKLVAMGRQDMVDLLFDPPFKHYVSKVKRYPNSPLLNNNLAWLCAMANRELDRALTHAEKAVSLEPLNGGYIDTLAEVHFRKGNAEKAIALEEKAIRLTPDNPTMKKQLERFKKGR